MRTVRQTLEFVLDFSETLEQPAAGDELRYLAHQQKGGETARKKDLGGSEEFFDVSVHAKAPAHD